MTLRRNASFSSLSFASCASVASWAALAAFAALPLVACSSSSSSGTSSPDAADAAPGPTPPGPSPDGGPTPTPPPPYPVEDGTSLVVGLDVEDFRQTLGVDLQKVHIATTVDGKPATDETIDLRSGNAIPHETTLKAPKGKKDAAVEILIEGFVPVDSSGPPPPAEGWPANVVRRATTRFVPDTARVLPIRLEARCASVAPALLGGSFFLGPVCDAPTTCIADKCQPEAVDPGSLPLYAKSWDTDMPDACRASAPSLTVGGGDTDYAPLADGATVQIVEGGQCGHHVWVGVKMAGMRQYGVVTTISATAPGTTLVAEPATFSFAYGDAGGGACEIGGLRYQLYTTGGGTWQDFLGKPMDLTVKVSDPTTGKSQTSTLHLQLTFSLSTAKNHTYSFHLSLRSNFLLSKVFLPTSLSVSMPHG